jgi:hypothetical protein
MPQDLMLKGQGVRVFDVLILGPFMMWFGWQAREMPTWARYAMMISGAGTSIYNGVNFVRRMQA